MRSGVQRGIGAAYKLVEDCCSGFDRDLGEFGTHAALSAGGEDLGLFVVVVEGNKGALVQARGNVGSPAEAVLCRLGQKAKSVLEDALVVAGSDCGTALAQLQIVVLGDRLGVKGHGGDVLSVKLFEEDKLVLCRGGHVFIGRAIFGVWAFGVLGCSVEGGGGGSLFRREVAGSSLGTGASACGRCMSGSARTRRLSADVMGSGRARSGGGIRRVVPRSVDGGVGAVQHADLLGDASGALLP